MNGELYQACCLAAAAKKALKEGTALSYMPLRYENRIEFQFLPQKKLRRTVQFKAADAPAWYEHCLQKGLSDIQLIVPVTAEHRELLGFSNASRSSVVCFWEKQVATYFSAHWTFDRAQKGWDILYQERP